MPELTACHACDLLIQFPASPVTAQTCSCPRCGTALSRSLPQSMERSTALTCAALILLVTANFFPIVSLELQGQHIEATILSACWQLWQDNMAVAAALLVFTTLLIPLAELFILAWLLLPLRRGYRPYGFVPLFRFLQRIQPWAMVEVFILGIVVSLIKLSHLADVLPGPGIGCFGGLAIVLLMLSTTLDYRSVWAAWEQAR